MIDCNILFLFLVVQFTLGPTSKKPMHIPLHEMTAEDAAEHATKVFLDVSILTRRILSLLSTDAWNFF